MQETEQAKVDQQDWIAAELAKLQEERPNIEQVEGLKMVENKLYEIDVDVSKPWEKWIDNTNGVVKKIIPVMFEDKPYNFWLNTANPLYKALLERCQTGQTVFKITRTGKAKDTRYNILE